MKVLFVSSGNNKDFKISPLIKAQADSLNRNGIELSFFTVIGTGITGYLKSGLRLRKYLKKNKFDIIHAHYVHCGWVALIGSLKTPLVMSLMGSDSYGEYVGQTKISVKSRVNTLLTYLIQPFVSAIIAKSPNILQFIYIKRKAFLVPNGVDLTFFNYINHISKEQLGLSPEKKYVLFMGTKETKRKNLELAEKAVKLLNRQDVVLISPYPIEYKMVPKYLSVADVLILTSFMEGSSNIIKEAMACNCPIVSTEVGDVKWILGNTEGCYLTSFNPEEVSKNIQKAIDFGKRTNGRERILELNLDAGSVADKLIIIYKRVIGLKTDGNTN